MLIVTFAAYRIPHFLAALSRALERSVKVSLIMESAQESEGKIRFEATSAIGSELLKRFELYYWPLDRRTRDSADRYGSLHAKCAVADNSVALVSSANLTEYAMSLNMELGIVIRGGDVPRNICTHFRRLMDDGHLLPLQIMP
ncbi:MAG: hypothetical protein IPK53_12135 [bacterium]|nr:hypothetical protein [bacterium]